MSPEETIKFTNLTKYVGQSKPEVQWNINSENVSQDWDYSTKLEPGKNTVRLTARDGEISDWAGEDVEVDGHAPDYPEKELKVKIKGICYLVGVPGWLDPIVPISRMEEDLTVIYDELGCNGIRIEGTVDDQILECGKIAVDKGYDYIVLNPRYIDADLDAYLKRVEKFSEKADELRKESGAVILQPVTELVHDTTIVFKEPTYFQRTHNFNEDIAKDPNWNWKVNQALDQILQICRSKFDGKITYGKCWYENVSWDRLDFDIIGSNEYFWPTRTESIGAALNRLKGFGKPVVATEFGSCTYLEACKYGGAGWMYGGPYNEDAQADCIKRYLDIFNQAEPYGCFLWCFYQVTHDWRTKDQTFSIMKPELPTTNHKLARKKAFHMYKSYKRAGS